MNAVAPWAYIDPQCVVAEVTRRFPCVRTCWRGDYTGSWWALTWDRDGRERLVEAHDPAELGRRLETLGGRLVPRFTRTAFENGAAARAAPIPPRVSRPAAPPRSNHRRPRQVAGRPSMIRRLLAALAVVESR